MHALPLVLLALPLFAHEEDPLPEPDPKISGIQLEQHVRWLSSDELRGREAGTPDAHRAARYLGKALASYGVEPGAADGTFLQAVPLERYEHDALPRLLLTLTDGSVAEPVFGEGFDLSVRGAPDGRRRLELRRVASAEEMPAQANRSEALFLDGKSRERRAWLASGSLDSQGRDWGLYVRAGSKRLGKAGSKPRSRLSRVEERPFEWCDVVSLRGPWREKLQAGEIAALELVLEAKRIEVVDYNAVGILRGVGTAERPELADQTVVFSAHYDHLGVREPAEGSTDGIFNGADDDASGVAAVLELAEAFAAEGPPARTLVFLLAGGEEKGLLGTRFYLEQPTVPLEQTVANLNFEMIGRPDALVGGPGNLWFTGFERSNLGGAFREAGLAIHPDERPEQGFFQRSDNYAFARIGIVGQTFSSYDLHKDYHHATDEIETLDFEHMLTVVQDAYTACKLVVDGKLDPEWLPGGNPAEK